MHGGTMGSTAFSGPIGTSGAYGNSITTGIVYAGETTQTSPISMAAQGSNFI